MRATFFLFFQRRCLLLLIPALLGACLHHPHHPEAKVVGLSDKEYGRLTTKAHAGDHSAAETLARLWYQYGEDNTRALYWLDVAAQNGSKRAERYSQMAKSLAQD